MNDEATIQFTDVRKVFAGRSGAEHVAVEDVSLLVDSTSRLGIVGESGSGKSTLVRMLMGLESASSGSVTYRGREMASLKRGDLREFRRNVQLVAQDPSCPSIHVEPCEMAFVGHCSSCWRCPQETPMRR